MFELYYFLATCMLINTVSFQIHHAAFKLVSPSCENDDPHCFYLLLLSNNNLETR